MVKAPLYGFHLGVFQVTLPWERLFRHPFLIEHFASLVDLAVRDSKIAFRLCGIVNPIGLGNVRLLKVSVQRRKAQQLQSNKTDEISARASADYLRLGLAEKKVGCTDEAPVDRLKTLARETQRIVNQSIDLQNELHALL